MNKNRRLSTRVILICGLFGVLLSFAIGTLGYFIYYNGMLEKYQTYLGNLLEYVACEFDIDNLEECIESKTVNDVFIENNDLINSIKDSYDIEYIYVVKPINADDRDNMLNIMAGEDAAERAVETVSEQEWLCTLAGDDYSGEVAAKYLERMQGTDEITYFSNHTDFGYMYSALKPLHNNKGEAVAILAVDINMNDVYSTKMYFIVSVCIGGIILTALFVILQQLYMKKRIVSSVEKLDAAAGEFVKLINDKTEPEELIFKQPTINTHDEIEKLSDSVYSMASNLKTYMSDLVTVTKERERIGAELNVATQIQASYLPSLFPPYPDRHEFDIFASMNPAKEVGGDFYDFFLIDKDHLCMVIADVSGKGVGAAMFMMISKTFINGQAHNNMSPCEILYEVNNRLCENNTAEMFVTVWLGILDIKTGKIVASNAGHEYPFIQRAGQNYELLKDKHGLALGAYPGVKYTEYEIELNKGDAIFVYTDGVAEATDSNDELFGTDRALSALNKNPDADMTTAVANMNAGIIEFVKEAPQFDDTTMLALRYLGYSI